LAKRARRALPRKRKVKPKTERVKRRAVERQILVSSAGTPAALEAGVLIPVRRPW